jgi:hypothetical protein
MKLLTAASAGVLALACGTFLAMAQVPSQVAPPDREPVAGAFPGFLDPSTQVFTPLGRGAATPGTTVKGTLHFLLSFQYDPDIKVNDSITCFVTLTFGFLIKNVVGITTSSVTSFNFGAFTSPPNVPIPYNYTAAPHLLLAIRVVCNGIDENGNTHTAVFSEIPQLAPNGDVFFPLQLQF